MKDASNVTCFQAALGVLILSRDYLWQLLFNMVWFHTIVFIFKEKRGCGGYFSHGSIAPNTPLTHNAVLNVFPESSWNMTSMGASSTQKFEEGPWKYSKDKCGGEVFCYVRSWVSPLCNRPEQRASHAPISERGSVRVCRENNRVGEYPVPNSKELGAQGWALWVVNCKCVGRGGEERRKWHALSGEKKSHGKVPPSTPSPSSEQLERPSCFLPF